MAKYRQIHLTFWHDPFVEELSPMEKYFYIYLMTNSRTAQCGCYEISMRLIKYETGLTQTQIDNYINVLVKGKKIAFNKDTNEFLLLNWLKHNSFKSPKVKACIVNELASIKDQSYKDYISDILAGEYSIDSLSIGYNTSIDTGSQEEEKEEEKEEEEKSKNPKNYRSVYDHYMTLNLVKHREYNDEMRDAMKHAEKKLGITVDDMIIMLTRHAEKVRSSKGTEYPTKKRGLAEFFGQKKYQSKMLICSDYLECSSEGHRVKSYESSNKIIKKVI